MMAWLGIAVDYKNRKNQKTSDCSISYLDSAAIDSVVRFFFPVNDF